MSQSPVELNPATANSVTVEQVIAVVRARGGRATPCRLTLLEVLFSADRAMTAVELAAVARDQSGRVDRSTVYRHIDELVRLGVVNRTHVADGPARFRLATVLHARLICDHCGSTTPAPASLVRNLTRQANAATGFLIDTADLAIPGRCRPCRVAAIDGTRRADRFLATMSHQV